MLPSKTVNEALSVGLGKAGGCWKARRGAPFPLPKGPKNAAFKTLPSPAARD